jgi:signal peptidase I
MTGNGAKQKKHKNDGRPKVEFSPSRILANGRSSSNLRISYPAPLTSPDTVQISRGSLASDATVHTDILEPGRSEYSLTVYSARRPGICKITSAQGLRAELAFYPNHLQAVVYDWIPTLITAFLIALFLRTYVVAAFYIPSRSMEPTLLVHDRLIADKISFVLDFGEIKRGEIVIFRPPLEAGESGTNKDYIKRVIGLSGDRIKIEDGMVWVNGVVLKESYIASPPAYLYDEATVPDDNLFVLGDNRNNSKDSHSWDFLPVENVIGRALFIFWPPSRVGAIR